MDVVQSAVADVLIYYRGVQCVGRRVLVAMEGVGLLRLFTSRRGSWALLQRTG